MFLWRRRGYESVPAAEGGGSPQQPGCGDLISDACQNRQHRGWLLRAVLAVLVTATVVAIPVILRERVEAAAAEHQAQYVLHHRQGPRDFLGHYHFYAGPDANGSLGFQNYVGEDAARSFGLVGAAGDGGDALDILPRWLAPDEASTEEFAAKPVSVRLEGKRRFDKGLFVFDVEHMPAGCGMWPAIWLTNEETWPDDGEIDVIEGVNTQSTAKTALHTTGNCSMETVLGSSMTGGWDVAEGVPDRKTGLPDPTKRDAKDCYVYAPKQWANQGCVAVDKGGDNFGAPLNKKGGGLFVLEWDPDGTAAPLAGPAGKARMPGGYLRSWAFVGREHAPHDLRRSLEAAGGGGHAAGPLVPDLWPKPYAYFRLDGAAGAAALRGGEAESTCASDHFKNMHLVVNIALCGAVAGEKFRVDCPAEYAKYHEEGADAREACEAYLADNRDALDEAYWRIRGFTVYQRSKSS